MHKIVVWHKTDWLTIPLLQHFVIDKRKCQNKSCRNCQRHLQTSHTKDNKLPITDFKYPERLSFIYLSCRLKNIKYIFKTCLFIILSCFLFHIVKSNEVESELLEIRYVNRNYNRHQNKSTRENLFVWVWQTEMRSDLIFSKFVHKIMFSSIWKNSSVSPLQTFSLKKPIFRTNCAKMFKMIR